MTYLFQRGAETVVVTARNWESALKKLESLVGWSESISYRVVQLNDTTLGEVWYRRPDAGPALKNRWYSDKGNELDGMPPVRMIKGNGK